MSLLLLFTSALVPGDYYISPDGDDSNNGLTTGTAWETLAKHNATTILSGSTVHLERDGIWRESLVAKDGVTYTAYGSGDKPSIRGSDTFASTWTFEGGGSVTDLNSAATADDGYFGQSGSGFNSSFDDLRTGDEDNVDQTVFLRFALTGPGQGETISDATLTLRASSTTSNAVTLEIQAVDADSPAAPTTAAEGQALSLTTASVTWTTPSVTGGTDYTTPDISSVIQEVVDRGGWASGNNIIIILRTTSAGTWSIKDFRSRNFATAAGRPRLNLDYGGSATLYYKGSVTSDPGVFVHDGVLGQRKATKVELTSQWDYWYDDANDRLYVFSSADPSTLATTLEYGVRTAILNNYNGIDATFDNLDVRHNQGDVVFGLFSENTCDFTDCDFTQHAKYVMQFNNGGGGSVSGCTFTDWGVVDTFGYAIQSIADGTPDALPCDIEDNTFTITHSSNSTEIAAALGDTNSYIRKFNRNVCDGTAGDWHGHGITQFRVGVSMTDFEILDNVFDTMGGAGILIDDIAAAGHSGGTFEVARNIIRDSCGNDVADVEAFRLRDWTSSEWVATVHHNQVQRTVDGTNEHHGIRVTAATGVLLYNNTVYGCDDGIRLDNDVTVRAPTATAKNNISSGNRLTSGRVTGSGTLTKDHNLWNGTRTGFTADATDIVDTDPLFANTATDNFSLQVTSPAIDAGTVIGGITDGYDGAAPDMGAIEAIVAAAATSAGTANNPTTTRTGNGNAGAGAGAGAANAATVTISTAINAATSAGTANNPSTTRTGNANAGVATGSGTANNATIPTGTDATAGVASSSGAANTTTSSVASNIGSGSGSGAGNTANGTLSTTAGVATSAGTADTPSIFSSGNTSATTTSADGAGTAYTTTSLISVGSEAAVSVGEADNDAEIVVPANVEPFTATGVGAALDAVVSDIPVDTNPQTISIRDHGHTVTLYYRR